MTESNIGRGKQRPYGNVHHHERRDCRWRYNGNEGSDGHHNPV